MNNENLTDFLSIYKMKHYCDSDYNPHVVFALLFNVISSIYLIL